MFSKRLSSLGVFLVLAAIGSGLLLAQSPQLVGTWVGVGTADNPFGNGASVAMTDGRTLIVGGAGPDGAPTNVVSSFDAATNQFAIAGTLLSARTGHTATLLKDGRVLVTGGISNGLVSTDIEIFDPSTGASALVAQMAEPRRGHVAALLQNGTVVIAGGYTTEDVILQSAFVFDPVTNAISPTPAGMSVPRASASATSLIDGRVVIIGGTSDGTNDLRSAEIFDPTLQSFTIVSTQLSVPLRGHSAVLLPNNGSVLVHGGTSNGVVQSGADLFLPVEFPDPFSWGVGQFAPANPMNAARSNAIAGPTATDGYSVVTGGGSNEVERYRFATIKTDKDDYPPGQTAIITGSGWGANEEVKLLFQEDPAVHDDYELSVTADGEGNIYHDTWAPEQHDANVRFYLMATGQQSGRRAQMTFTDSVNFNNLQIASQVPIAVAPGDIATFVITIKFNVNGAPTPACTVSNFTATGLTAINATATFSPTSVTSSGADEQVTMTVTTTGTTPIGNNNGLGISAVGTSGCTDNKSGSFALRVEAATSLNLAVPSPASVTQGNAGPVTLSATLSRGATLLNNQTVNFRVDGISVGSGTTNASGVATSSYIPSALGIGPHTVTAFYAGANNVGAASTSNAQTLTVTNAAVSITVNTNPAGRSFTVDGTTYTTAQTFSWTPGTSHTIATTSTQSGVSGVRYNWMNWNDGGLISHSVTAPSSATTYTANFQTQYELTFSLSGVENDYTGTVVTIGGSPIASNSFASNSYTQWVDANTAAPTVFWTGLLASTVTGKRYDFQNASPSTLTSPVTGPQTMTASYQRQWLLTFNLSGVDNDYTGTVVTVDGAPIASGAFSSNSYTQWVNGSSSAPIVVWTDPLASTVTGKRYDFLSATSLSTPVNGPQTITASYQKQWLLTFSLSGVDEDYAGTVVTIGGIPIASTSFVSNSYQHWSNAGPAPTVMWTGLLPSTVTGKRYDFQNATTPTTPVNGPQTITATYLKQWLLTFNLSGVDSDYTGTVLTVGGLPIASGEFTSNSYTQWVNDNSAAPSVVWAEPLSSSVAGKRYHFVDSSPASLSTPVTVPQTITANYQKQWLLTFSLSGVDNDYTGTVVTIAGLAVASGSFTSNSYTQWVADGSSPSVAWEDPLASTITGKRYDFLNTTPALVAPVIAAQSITANYKKQWLLTLNLFGVDGDYTGTVVTINGSPVTSAAFTSDSSSQWVNDNTPLVISWQDPLASTVTGKRYDFLSATPALISPATAPQSVTANYQKQWLLTFSVTGVDTDYTGTVVTIGGSPIASGAFSSNSYAQWVNDNTAAPSLAWTDPMASTVMGKRYAFVSAGSLSTPVLASQIITANYQTQWLLTLNLTGVENDYTGTVVTIAGSPITSAAFTSNSSSQWVNGGTSPTVAWQDPLASSVTGKQYDFLSANLLSTPVSAPQTLTATYQKQWLLTFNLSGVDVDYSGTVVTIAGSPVLAAAFTSNSYALWVNHSAAPIVLWQDPLASTVQGKRYDFLNATTLVTPVTGPQTITANYQKQWLLTWMQSGLSETGGHTVLTVNGSPKTLGAGSPAPALLFSDWFNHGVTVPYAYSTPISTDPVSSVQFELIGVSTPSPVTVTSGLTITGSYATNNYTIQYLQPLDQTTGPTNYHENNGKNGRVIPVKVQIFKNGTAIADTSTVYIKLMSVQCGSSAGTGDPIEEYADAGASNGNTNLFRWSTPQWIYNLDTKGVGLQNSNCYRFDVYLNSLTGSTSIKASAATWAVFKPVK